MDVVKIHWLIPWLINWVHVCPSKDQRTRQLFEFEKMGDRRPSQFLRHLRSLAPDISADYLKIIWTSRLPPNIRTILAGLPEVEQDAAALCADRIIETISMPAVASITPGPDYSELLRQVRDLSLRITNLMEENKRLSDIVRQDTDQRHHSRSISWRRSTSCRAGYPHLHLRFSSV
jgi:hypothetical protein